jgi:hypothetical protein
MGWGTRGAAVVEVVDDVAVGAPVVGVVDGDGDGAAVVDVVDPPPNVVVVVLGDGVGDTAGGWLGAGVSLR